MNIEIYNHIIGPERLSSVDKLIDATIEDVSNAGEAVEKAYGDRAALQKALTQLDGTIKLTEATAFMQIDEKNMVEIDGKQVKLSNGEMRDMYRRYVSRDLRKEKTEKEADLKEIEINIMQAKDRWEEAKTASDLVQAKAWVQANLLKFLSGKA